MLINVDKLPREGLKVSRDFEFSSLDLVEENAVFLQPVWAEMSINRIGDEIRIKGKVKTCFSFVCSRCLMPFKFPVDSSFDLIYLPEELDILKEELGTEDLNNYFYRDQQIDLREVVLEQLNLTFPVKPLCSEKCQGICPVCGKNQKDGKCGCVVEDSDPRLQKLKSFIKDRR
ncbi:MAG: hypothetical protein GTO17_09655 [Candidatus Aminicenantes bacterium]|nr:hypothetical protein [Candidatus Aminicenantes bacterium]